MRSLDRRFFLAGTASAFLGACTMGGGMGSLAYAPSEGGRILVPDTNEPHRVPPVDLGTIPAQYHRQIVGNPTGESPGTIVVDPGQRYLYLVMEDGRARRYGIGVGRQGFGWNGVATVGTKRKWPSWHPPVEMQARDERAREFANGMEGGTDNPLGARALYLYQDGRDTLFRIHGTNEPQSIGRAVSSGCIRMLNADVIDLYDRVPTGTRVVVLPASNPIARLGRGFGQAVSDPDAGWRQNIRRLASGPGA
jgi:lipoprotein-anchoring transpeptidase ErfK/SrfK